MTTGSGVVTGKQQPQTTIEPAGGPFIRHSQPGRKAMYQVATKFGGLVSQPLSSTPGYVKGFRYTISASGGSGTSVAGQPDAPESVVALVTVKDSFGNPLLVGPGFEILRLLPMFSGQFGLGKFRDTHNLQSFSAIAAGSGDFSFSTYLPLEFVKAYGVISGANASLLPTITLNMGTTGDVYSTVPATTVPDLSVSNDADFYWLPEGVDVQPPGLGTTCQWVYQQANPAPGEGSTTTVQFPRLGGYLTEMIMILRDSTGARVDAWPSRFRLIVDGVPLIDSDIDEIYDDMQITYGDITRPTGVLCFSRKTSLSQAQLGLLDTGETYLSTNPGTLIEVQGAPWGTAGTGPYTLSCLFGQVVPAGTLIQGLPEV